LKDLAMMSKCLQIQLNGAKENPKKRELKDLSNLTTLFLDLFWVQRKIPRKGN